jgi:hypothetical protein
LQLAKLALTAEESSGSRTGKAQLLISHSTGPLELHQPPSTPAIVHLGLDEEKPIARDDLADGSRSAAT